MFSDRYTATSTAIAVSQLAQNGHRVAAHVDSDGVGVASDRDAEAAQILADADADADVDLLLPFVSGSSLAAMLRVAERIGFRPTILDLETGEHATDVSGAAMPPSIYEGTSALAMTRVVVSRCARSCGPINSGKSLVSTARSFALTDRLDRPR